MAKVFHFEEVGKNLEWDGHKLNVVGVVTGIKIDGNNLVLTIDGVEQSVALPKMPVDVKLQGAEITDDNKLRLTLSNGDVIESDLAKFVDAPKSAQEMWDDIKALPSFKADLIELLKGEEVKNFGDELKGYLLATE